jgi:methylmalonyl-CoA mutase C-terminal domain/subunit
MTLIPKVVDEIRAREIDPLIFAGGIISGDDIDALKAHGVAEVFTPGSPLATITDWLEATLDQRTSEPTP